MVVALWVWVKYFCFQKQTSIICRNKPAAVTNNVSDAYGYVISWKGLQSVKALTALMKQGVKVRFSETPFETNGQQFDRGSLIIIKKGNEKFGNSLASIINQTCNANNVKANTDHNRIC